MIKVINIAQFIPIKGIHLDNDISLKIYSDLKHEFGVQSEFIKRVGNIPAWATIVKKSLKLRYETYSIKEYYDNHYKIRIHFYKDTFPFINRIPFNTDALLPMQFRIYKESFLSVITEYKPDLVHAHSFYPDGYYALEVYRHLNIPYILTLRGSICKLYNSTIGKNILRNASAITTPSYALWSHLSSDYKIELIPHGVDDKWFVSKQKEFQCGTYKLVTVSRLLKMKNIQVVLIAIAHLINCGYKIEYEIVGDGDYRPSLERLAKKLLINEFVRFHGYQDANYIKRIYENSDIFVMLSYPETYGRSFFEAAAQGLYIIGTRNTGAHGHLTENEASFIDINVMQLVDVLKRIDSSEFYRKTNLLLDKVNEMRNPAVLNKYYQLITNAIIANN